MKLMHLIKYYLAASILEKVGMSQDQLEEVFTNRIGDIVFGVQNQWREW